jgi:hypothetical protein
MVLLQQAGAKKVGFVTEPVRATAQASEQATGQR